MTNHHVIPDADYAGRCGFEFGYQLDRRGLAQPVLTARAAPAGMFRTSPLARHNAGPAELDYTLVALEGVPSGIEPLTVKATAIQLDERVAIIQHPGGDYKKVSMQNNFVEYADDLVVQYTTSTEPGSSGAPVLNEDFAVIAIHHAGGNLSEPSTRRRYLRNEGVRMSAILDDLRRDAPDLYQRITR